VILATQEAETRRITIQSAQANGSQDTISKILNTTQEWVKWYSTCLPSMKPRVQTPVQKDRETERKNDQRERKTKEREFPKKLVKFYFLRLGC
jgi:hypothetical protein